MGVNWKPLTTITQVDEIIEASHQKVQLIFKHSTTCGISAMMKGKFEDDWDLDEDEADVYYLDLLSYREVSNYVFKATGVYHQSPQVITLKDGKAVLDASHHAIKVEAIRSVLAV